MIKYYNIPFYIVIVSAFVNIPMGWSGLHILYWSPEIIIIGLTVITNIRFRVNFILLLVILLTHSMVTVYMGVGTGIISIIRIVVLSNIMYFYMSSNSSSHIFINQIEKIFLIHLLFILLETILINIDRTDIIAFISNNSYKADMHEIYGRSVPQSIFLQSQAASQLIVLYLIWLIYKIKFKNFNAKIANKDAVLLIISLYNLIAFPNSTAFVMLLVQLGVLVLIPQFVNLKIKLITLGSIALAFPLVMYKFNTNYEYYDLYMKAFFDPLRIFDDYNLNLIALGIGDMNSFKSYNTDGALLVLMFQAGIVLSLLLLLIIMAIIKKTIYSMARYKKLNIRPINDDWLWLAGISLILLIGQLISLAHYSVILNTGGLHLLSFTIALMMLSTKKVIQSIQLNKGYFINGN